MSRARKFINFIESMSRYCLFYKAINGKWYMELASREYGGRSDATTYGPFSSYESAYEYLDQFSNPGGFSVDKDGKAPIPDKSPNGMPVEAPKTWRDNYGYRDRQRYY